MKKVLLWVGDALLLPFFIYIYNMLKYFKWSVYHTYKIPKEIAHTFDRVVCDGSRFLDDDGAAVLCRILLRGGTASGVRVR